MNVTGCPGTTACDVALDVRIGWREGCKVREGLDEGGKWLREAEERRSEGSAGGSALSIGWARQDQRGWWTGRSRGHVPRRSRR